MCSGSKFAEALLARKQVLRFGAQVSVSGSQNGVGPRQGVTRST